MRLKLLLAGLAFAIAALPATAHELFFGASMSGPKEADPNMSPGTGTALVTFDTDLMTMKVQALFFGLIGSTSAAHIHCCTTVAGAGAVGVATQTPSFEGFPLGVQFGAYDHLFDMTQAGNYQSVFLAAAGGTPTAAFNALVNGIEAGKAYFNIHTMGPGGFPTGEIRGFMQAVPEPETYAMMLAGLAVLGWIAARRRKL